MEKIKVGIVGNRGIPATYGGFETFTEEIAPLLVKQGFDVIVYCDKSDSKSPLLKYKGVNLMYQKTRKSKHTLLFYLEGIYYALKRNDIVLVTGTAGSFFYFLNLFFRKKIVTNTDGVESRRAKWSYVKKKLIKLSEILAIRFSKHLVADSFGITNYLLEHYSRIKKEKISTIEYGAPINRTCSPETLKKYGLLKNQYYLVVARLEPENNIKMIINGFRKSTTDKQLVIIGNLINTEYVNEIKQFASNKIVFLGGIYNKDELMTLRKAAFAYMHGHSVGGTNPSLLEALGSSNISLCHDNIFNREVTDNKQLYFNCENELAKKVNCLEKMESTELNALKDAALNRIENYYTWQNIAYKYTNLFNKL